MNFIVIAVIVLVSAIMLLLSASAIKIIHESERDFSQRMEAVRLKYANSLLRRKTHGRDGPAIRYLVPYKKSWLDKILKRRKLSFYIPTKIIMDDARRTEDYAPDWAWVSRNWIRVSDPEYFKLEMKGWINTTNPESARGFAIKHGYKWLTPHDEEVTQLSTF